MKVELQYQEQNIFLLDRNHQKQLDEFLSHTSKRTVKRGTKKSADIGAVAGEGRIYEIVPGTSCSDTSLRRSTRQRRKITHEFT